MKKLFGYMLVLAALLLLSLFMGLLIFGRFETIEKKTFDALDVQMEVFEKDVSSHFDALAAAGIHLSKDLGILLDDYLTGENLTMADLTDDGKRISQVQSLMTDSLKQMLGQEDCSGIFVMLEATVNSSLPQADCSRTGLYLQVNGYEKESPQDRDILLYRGIADTGKTSGIMPHRKWRLEFRTDLFPSYDLLVSLADKPAHQAYLFTDLTLLPGTSDQVVLLALPVAGADGTFYGICGLELSSSYFMTFHAQPTKVDHLTCLLSPGDGSLLQGESALSCGASGGYYRSVHETLSAKSMSSGLSTFSGESSSYIGITRSIQLSPNSPACQLAVMIPESDFAKEARHSLAKNLSLILLLLFFTITSCYGFIRRFIGPVLRELEQVKKEFAQTQKQYETAQTEISRLAYSRKTEVDPDIYRQFVEAIATLTPTERRIFDYYVEGHTVKEILTIAGIKESTLRYHNQNIYSKLGVNSLKQLLRCAALMNQDKAAAEATPK